MSGALRFRGTFDEARLRAAVAELSKAYPLLRASIVADPYIRFSMRNAPDLIRLDLLPRESDEHWRRIIEEGMASQFKEGEGLGYLTVLRGEDAFDIMFTVSHCVADGLTGGIVCRNLIHLYNGDKIEHLPLKKPMEPRFPWFYRGVIGWLLAFRFVFSLAKLGPALQVGSKESTRHTLTQGFNFYRPRDLNRLARERGSNLFGVISAIILQSIYELYGDGSTQPVSLNTPVSLRPGIKTTNEEFGVFLAGHLALYQVGPETDTWELAKQCYETLNRGVMSGKPFLLAKLARGARRPKAPSLSDKYADRRPTVNISNMGRVEPFPKMGDAEVTEHRAAAAQSIKDAFAFTLVSYDGKMFIDLQTSLEKLGREESRRILATVQKNLAKIMPALA